mgnify:CR=1 FL=1
MDEALRELINTIKDLSPAVWEAALVQVRVQAWLNFGLAGVFLLVAIGLAYISFQQKRMIDREEHSSYEKENIAGWVLLLAVLSILAIVPAIGNIYYSLLYLLSPDWAAIQLILEQVK